MDVFLVEAKDKDGKTDSTPKSTYHQLCFVFPVHLLSSFVTLSYAKIAPSEPLIGIGNQSSVAVVAMVIKRDHGLGTGGNGRENEC